MPAHARHTSASAAFHRSIQRASKLFGGHYGQLPASIRSPTHENIQLDTVELQTLTWDGHLPALVLLHGLNNNAWSWARFASCLAPGRKVVAVCLRGHGGSSAPCSGYGLDVTTNDLLGMLDRLGLDRVDLAGHSWGGKVATHFNTVHPQRVRSLLLADPAPPKGLNRLIRSVPALSTLSLRAERGPFRDRKAWEHAGKSVNYLHHWDDIDQNLWTGSFIEQRDGSYRHVLPESAFEEVLHHVLAEDIEPALPRVTGPVLLMRPTFTLSFLPGELRSMRRALPQMVERRIPGDHTFIHTNPLDTADAVRSFLASI